MAHDVVVVGGGHNGLIAAALLARAGLSTLVLEQRDQPGGCALTSELSPGVRCPTLTHRAAIAPGLVRTLGLEQLGLEIVRPPARACAPAADGRALVLWEDHARASEDIAKFSDADARQYAPFLASVSAVSRVLREFMDRSAPDLDAPSGGDLLHALRTFRRFRALGKADAYRLLRWLPMSAADLACEWFSSEPLRATVAASGVLGAFLGPRSSGSAAMLLLLTGHDGQPIASGWAARGGPGAIVNALAAAARTAGAVIRTGVEVARIAVRDGVATGVVLASGEEIPASRAVVSNADPRRTLLDLVGPAHLPAEVIHQVRHIRMRGTLAKVNFAVSGVPPFTCIASMPSDERLAALSGCIRLNSSLDAIERAFDRAKYGTFSDDPWIELAIPSIGDATLTTPGQHVVSAYVQFVPRHLAAGTWDDARDQLGDVVTLAIDRHAPGFVDSILARQVITPLDLERNYALSGGQIFHGEIALDQLAIARPLLGWGRHDTPIAQLFLCGTGTHPGTGLDGRSGMVAARDVIAHLKRGQPRADALEAAGWG